MNAVRLLIGPIDFLLESLGSFFAVCPSNKYSRYQHHDWHASIAFNNFVSSFVMVTEFLAQPDTTSLAFFSPSSWNEHTTRL